MPGTHSHKNYISKRSIRLLLVLTLLFMVLLLTSCKPSLPLNPKYSYTHFNLEIGETVSDDIKDYIDIEHMSDEDAKFALENTEILFDGETTHTKEFDAAGEHTLVLNYCGRQYRKYSITISDNQPPEISALHNVYTFVGLGLSEDQLDNLFTASDNSGEVNVEVTKPEVKYDKAGTYHVKAVATDPSGNKSTATADVVVQDPKYGAQGTYVFVSIKNQHVTFFKDGKAIFDSPVVTGNPYTGHATPKGTFTLNYKSRNVTLKGTEDNGDKYESFVSYWMAFIGASVGLHDASWRNTFGGEIYKGGGSHGCVNMPYKAAKEIYELLEPGIPILVY